jgi:hypothetical protein
MYPLAQALCAMWYVTTGIVAGIILAVGWLLWWVIFGRRRRKGVPE